MKIFGYLLIGLGLIDLITSWTLEYGSPIDPIVGPTIAPYYRLHITWCRLFC